MNTATLKFVQICPSDMIAMGAMLTPEEDGIFVRLYLRIAACNDRMEDDDSRVASLLRISTRRWRAVKEQLIRAGLVAVEAGRLVIADATKRLQKAANSQRQKSEAGKASSEARKLLKGNETASTVVGTAVTTAVGAAEATADLANRKPLTENREKEKSAALRSAAVAAVLEVFEQERCAVFGEGARRPHPESADEAHAAEWLEAGASVDLLRSVFRSVNQKFRDDGRGPVRFLSAVQRDVAMALAAGNSFRRQLDDARKLAEAKRPEAVTAAEGAEAKASAPPVSRLERDRAFWLPVLEAWRKTGEWDRSAWGWSMPGERLCRVPVTILREFDPELADRQEAANAGGGPGMPAAQQTADAGSAGETIGADGLKLLAELRQRINRAVNRPAPAAFPVAAE